MRHLYKLLPPAILAFGGIYRDSAELMLMAVAQFFVMYQLHKIEVKVENGGCWY